MSYQVIARKYRPQTFSDLAGQEHITRTLTRALDQQRLHHAYFFTGTRGVGKTTLSRILAKSFNCIGADGNGGEYVYWFDSAGKYWQTNLPYLVTTDNNRNGVLTSPIKK